MRSKQQKAPDAGHGVEGQEPTTYESEWSSTMRLPSSTDIDQKDDTAAAVREWATITLCSLGSLAIIYFTAMGLAASMIAWGWTA